MDDIRVAALRHADQTGSASSIPPKCYWWYHAVMSGTFAVTMGDRGRLVVPQELRERAGLDAGTPLVLVEAEGGVLLLTREQAKARVRASLAGHDLVGDLLTERRRTAQEEHRR